MQEIDNQITKLINAIEKLNKHHGLWLSFLRGMVGGLGATLGVGIVLGLLGYVLQQLAVVPAFKESVETLLPRIQDRAITIPTDEEIDLPVKQASIPTPTPTTTPSPSPSPSSTPTPTSKN